MTNQKKVPFTLRLREDISKQIEKEAAKKGITKTAYINLIIHEQLESSKQSK